MDDGECVLLVMKGGGEHDWLLMCLRIWMLCG